MERVQALTAQLEEVQDFQARALADELSRRSELYGEGLERICGVDDGRPRPARRRRRRRQPAVDPRPLSGRARGSGARGARQRAAIHGVPWRRRRARQHRGRRAHCGWSATARAARRRRPRSSSPSSRPWTRPRPTWRASRSRATPASHGRWVRAADDALGRAWHGRCCRRQTGAGGAPAWTELEGAAPDAGNHGAHDGRRRRTARRDRARTAAPPPQRLRLVPGAARSRADGSRAERSHAPRGERRFELRRAGRSPDDEELQIAPVPLLRGEGSFELRWRRHERTAALARRRPQALRARSRGRRSGRPRAAVRPVAAEVPDLAARASTSTCSISEERRIVRARPTRRSMRSGEARYRPTGSRTLWLEGARAGRAPQRARPGRPVARLTRAHRPAGWADADDAPLLEIEQVLVLGRRARSGTARSDPASPPAGGRCAGPRLAHVALEAGDERGLRSAHAARQPRLNKPLAPEQRHRRDLQLPRRRVSGRLAAARTGARTRGM